MEGVCDEKGLVEYVRKASPPPFLLKTYMLVEDLATDDVVSWNEDGSAFVVWQPAEFARDLLPTLFKHSNFSSFVRQLNTYGFRKVSTSRWEFCNDKFRKGEKDQLCDIRRRKAWANKQQPIINNNNDSLTEAAGGAVALRAPHDHDHHQFDEDQRSSSTSSSSSEFSSLVDENKRLKEENGVLSSELTCMKRKCRELLDLVAKYGDSADKQEEENYGERSVPKLFGVRLEVEGERERKRKRAELSESASILLSQPCK